MYNSDDQKKSNFPTVQDPIAAWNAKTQTTKQLRLSPAVRETLHREPNNIPEKILQNSQTSNKLSSFIEQMSEEAATKVTEQQFQNLTEQLQITVLHDENLQQRFKQNLFESFKLFKKHYQIYEDKLTPELIQQFQNCWINWSSVGSNPTHTDEQIHVHIKNTCHHV